MLEPAAKKGERFLRPARCAKNPRAPEHRPHDVVVARSEGAATYPVSETLERFRGRVRSQRRQRQRKRVIRARHLEMLVAERPFLDADSLPQQGLGFSMSILQTKKVCQIDEALADEGMRFTQDPP